MTDKLLVIARKELQSRRLPCRLTEEEKIERCKDLAGAVEQEAEARAAWDMAKERVKTMKEALDACSGRVFDISQVINSGTETRSVDCRTVMDYEKKMLSGVGRRLQRYVQRQRDGWRTSPTNLIDVCVSCY